MSMPMQSECVAIVGSGPSGFYAAEVLLKQGMRVDMFERLPVPFGLVRSGVAPDHPKLKQAIQVYQKIAESPGYRLLANVTVGRDISLTELQAHYRAVIFTCGAEADRELGIPGEHLSGSHTATEFVGWYNGHPDYRDRSFDLSGDTAVIIGQGNVAVDVARILAKTPDELRHTDIAAHALEALAASRIREIHIIGRRGPVQAKFTHGELRELGELSDCVPVVLSQDLQLNPASSMELQDRASRTAVKNMETLTAFAALTAEGKRRRCHVSFMESPVRLEGEGRVQRIVLERNELSGEPFCQSSRGTGQYRALECGLVFRSIGYKGRPMPGLPFDARKGTFPNREGRIVGANDAVIPGLYCAGWIKRGPSGIIGTNRADAVETVKVLLDDLARLGRPQGNEADAAEFLQKRGVRVLDFAAWKRIDLAEIARGTPASKPREKFTRVEEMLAASKLA